MKILSLSIQHHDDVKSGEVLWSTKRFLDLRSKTVLQRSPDQLK